MFKKWFSRKVDTTASTCRCAMAQQTVRNLNSKLRKIYGSYCQGPAPTPNAFEFIQNGSDGAVKWKVEMKDIKPTVFKTLVPNEILESLIHSDTLTWKATDCALAGRGVDLERKSDYRFFFEVENDNIFFTIHQYE